MEYYIYNIPVFIIDEDSPDHDIIPAFCEEVESYLSPAFMSNIEVVYVGNFKHLGNRNAAFSNGGIYMRADEPTSFDLLQNFIHEVAHSLEPEYGMELYSDSLKEEFLGKRERLRHLLEEEGFEINPLLYQFTEYSQKFDEFLAFEVGYPTLLTLTMGLFASPYGATSLQEYFANGFEKYFLESPRRLRDTSPILYDKIEEIIDDKQT
tara:strand:+ start:103 stop:726 length:624 start_codon:yes stop_codon:yes gene_type:complete